MKTILTHRIRSSGNALVMTLIMMAVAMMLLAGILSWSSGNARLITRSNQYTRALAAAEAAAEKVNSRMASDYLSSGEVQVVANLSSYRSTVPTSTDSSYWADWEFNDANGNTNATMVMQGAVSNFTVLTSAYAGLTGFASTYAVISNAREITNFQSVTAGVLEEIQLIRIPIFQFAMYSSGDMEVSCGQKFVVNGPVHANGQLYIEPDAVLEFQSGVTAVGNVFIKQRNPLDTRVPPVGSVVFDITTNNPLPSQPALTLPIGTTNTPTAVREIIEPPAFGESSLSAISRLRYYNQVDLLITVTNGGILVTSGAFNGFGTVVPATNASLFVDTNSTFADTREGKTVLPLNINVAGLTNWSAINTNIRPLLHRDICSIYVADFRTVSSSQLRAVRVFNGLHLPPFGLTIATMDPLYVQGHYNENIATNLGTKNVTGTLPASFVGDAITILSTAWTDGNSTSPLASRVATATTVNAAILSGEVDTTLGHYSGGMENFPRFLESWTSIPFTYNGSMVKMFPSLYATNVWGQNNVYNPPPRNWTYNTNFNNPSLLPPLTPSLQVVDRSLWAAITPNSTNAP